MADDIVTAWTRVAATRPVFTPAELLQLLQSDT
jgi:hypothetical protein